MCERLLIFKFKFDFGDSREPSNQKMQRFEDLMI